MAESKKVHLTKTGLLEQQKKYEALIKARAEIANRLEVARAQGDLSENSEYDEAKEAQANNEREIAKTEAILKNFILIEEDENDLDKVHLGIIVTLLDVEFKDEDDYLLVGSTEADPLSDPPKISNESPLGRAIMGKKKGEKVKVAAPDGDIENNGAEVIETYKCVAHTSSGLDSDETLLTNLAGDFTITYRPYNATEYLPFEIILKIEHTPSNQP